MAEDKVSPPYYRAYVMGRDDRILKAIELDCRTDEEAVRTAQGHVDGHDIELWERGRLIARLTANDRTED